MSQEAILISKHAALLTKQGIPACIDSRVAIDHK